MAAGFVVGFIVTPRFSSFFIDDTSDRPLNIQEAAAYTRARCAPRMLVLRGVDDEAALSLAVGAIGARLSYIILFSIIPWVYGRGDCSVAFLASSFWTKE